MPKPSAIICDILNVTCLLCLCGDSFLIQKPSILFTAATIKKKTGSNVSLFPED